MAKRNRDPERRPRRKVCTYCGYDHDDDFESELAAMWHSSHDASCGLRLDPYTLRDLG